MELKGSVGRGGQNQKADVILVQSLLNKRLPKVLSLLPLVEDGIAGEKTYQAIEAFQKRVVGMVSPDGKIDAGGRSWKRLCESVVVESKLIQLPRGLTTLYYYSPAAQQFGTVKAIASIQLLARRARESLGVTIGVGDISYEDGKLMPPHKSHRNGVDVDVRPIRKDKKALPVTIASKDYDSAMTKKLVEIAKRDPNLQSILFNDKTISGVTSYQGHDNHLHIKYRQ